MTEQQYEELCKILEKRPTSKELKKMHFSQVDGKFDKALAEDIGLFKYEEYERTHRKD